MDRIEDRLCAKTVLQILQGDVYVGYFTPANGSESIQLQMPYLSGPDICDIANRVGIPLKYDGTFSRWQYMDKLISGCITAKTLPKLFQYLFSQSHVSQRYQREDRRFIEQICQETVDAVIERINGEWILGDVKLCRVGDGYTLQKVSNVFVPNTEKVECIDSNYIRRLADRAKQDIRNTDFDGAISKARTLLEEVFCFMIEKQGMSTPDKGDIVKLYNRVKEIYGMHENKEFDSRINDLLSGINKIVDSVSRMRNISGDAHGLGERRIGVSEHHAVLVLNTACSLSDFMLSVCENSNKS